MAKSIVPENHYVYQITFEEVPHIYFGSRSCKCLPEDDVRYMGSPKTYKQYWKDYTPVKTILFTEFETREEANAYEAELIRQQWERNKTLSLNANINNEKFNTVGRPKTQKQIESIRRICLGKKLTPEHIEAIRQGNLGRIPTTEQRLAVSLAQSRPFYLISPSGEIFEGVNLRQFCKTENLNRGNCDSVMRGLKLHYKGWTASIEAHQLYLKYYAERGLTWQKSNTTWRVRKMVGKKRVGVDFKVKADAIAYRDLIEKERGYEFTVNPVGWKELLNNQSSSEAA